MSRRLRFVVTALVLTLFVFSYHAPAYAHTYSGSVAFTCTDFTAAGTGADTLDRDNTGAGLEAVRIDVVDGNDVLLYTLTFSNSLGTYAAGLINTTPYSTAPTANPIMMIVTSLAGNGFSEQVTVYGTGNCAGLPNGTARGPQIPAGFVLKYITCTVSVFSEPDLSHSLADTLKEGQTWYVNPKSVTGTDGKQWTEVFVSGYQNVYIPTRCVR